MTTLRPGVAGDRDAILDLWERLMACGTDADPRFRPTSDARGPMSAWMDRWFAPAPFRNLWVAEDAGSVVGFVNAIPTPENPIVAIPASYRITDMYVADSHRRQGIGRRLVERLIAEAEAAGYRRGEVGTLTRDARAVAFWKSLGFGDWQVTLSRS